MRSIANVADYRVAARRRLPRFLFDYIDGGALTERTLAANAAELQAIGFRQRVMSGVGAVDLSTAVLGESLALPVILAPIGLGGLTARRGEVQAARAARTAGVPFTLSTVALCSVEEVAREGGTAPWFQLYVTRDRGFMRAMLARAQAAGCRTLVFTVDMSLPGIRYRDRRSGLSGGTRLRRALRLRAQALRRPRWACDVGLLGRPLVLGNLAELLGRGAGVENFWGWMADNFDPTVTWRDLDEVRAHWSGTLIIKGVLEPEDARAAVAAGAQGVVVSNHGGRQLDGADAAITALPAIVEAMGDRAAVLMDGGIRSGADVVRALALGARAVLIGRPWVWALGACGQRGVTHLLDLLAQEMRLTMALTGVASVDGINRSLLSGRR